jgi:hypothetical protein
MIPEKYWVLAIGAAMVLIGIGSNIRVGSINATGPGRKAGAVAAVFGGVIALVGLVSALWPQRLGISGEPVPTVTVTVTPSPSQPPSFRFVGVPPTVPMCARFAGTGNIPSEMSVVLFDREAGGNTTEYYFDGIGKPDGDGLVFPEVTIGEPNQAGIRVELVAVIVDDDVATYLEGVDSGGEEAWHSSGLPGPVAARIEVERNSNSTPCG